MSRGRSAREQRIASAPFRDRVRASPGAGLAVVGAAAELDGGAGAAAHGALSAHGDFEPLGKLEEGGVGEEGVGVGGGVDEGDGDCDGECESEDGEDGEFL